MHPNYSSPSPLCPHFSNLSSLQVFFLHSYCFAFLCDPEWPWFWNSVSWCLLGKSTTTDLDYPYLRIFLYFIAPSSDSLRSMIDSWQAKCAAVPAKERSWLSGCVRPYLPALTFFLRHLRGNGVNIPVSIEHSVVLVLSIFTIVYCKENWLKLIWKAVCQSSFSISHLPMCLPVHMCFCLMVARVQFVVLLVGHSLLFYLSQGLSLSWNLPSKPGWLPPPTRTACRQAFRSHAFLQINSGLHACFTESTLHSYSSAPISLSLNVCQFRSCIPHSCPCFTD